MRFLQGFLTLSILIHGSLSVRVTVEGGQTGTITKEIETGAQSLLLPCSVSATSSSGDVNLEWSSGSSVEDQTNIIYYQKEILNPDKYSLQNPYSLVIKNIVPSDSGFYKCRGVIIQDSPPSGDAYYDLTVLVPPYEQISCGFPQDLAVTIGQGAQFHCAEVVKTAQPAPKFEWFKNEVKLPLSSASSPTQYPNSSFTWSETTGILEFKTVVSGDAGTYYCKATNKVGTAQCSAAAITTKEVNVGQIVGIVFGVLFAIILIGVLIWWTYRRGYCDSFIGKGDIDDDAPDDGANDIMLDGAGPLVTKAPSEYSNGTSHKDSMRSSGPYRPDGAVRVMP